MPRAPASIVTRIVVSSSLVDPFFLIFRYIICAQCLAPVPHLSISDITVGCVVSFALRQRVVHDSFRHQSNTTLDGIIRDVYTLKSLSKGTYSSAQSGIVYSSSTHSSTVVSPIYHSETTNIPSSLPDIVFLIVSAVHVQGVPPGRRSPDQREGLAILAPCPGCESLARPPHG